MIDWGKKAENKMMAALLHDDLEEISSRKRLEANGGALLRSIWKYFGTGWGAYKKGVGIKKFVTWVRKNYPKRHLFTTPRGDNGSRQDWSVDAAFDVYFNRDLYVAYLEDEQFKDANILADSIFTKLTSNVFIGMLRARAIVKHRISGPFRFLSNSNDLPDFDSTDMSQYMDHLEDVLLQVEKDGNVLLDRNFVVFDGCDELDLWEEEAKERGYDAMDGTGLINFYEDTIMQELYSPEDETNREATDHCVTFLQEWAKGMLLGLHKNCHEYLNSQKGQYSVDAMEEKPGVKAALKGSDRTNNRLGETMFAYFDYRYRRSPNFLISTVSGMTMARKNKIFEKGGAYDVLSAREKDALMEMVVRNHRGFVEANRLALQEQLDHQQMRRKFELDKALLKSRRAYSDCIRYFRIAGEKKISSATELQSKLTASKSENTRKELLKEQINMRVKGYGWKQFTKAFSKKGEANIGSVQDLTEWVEQMLTDEARLQVPTEAHVPCPKRKGNPIIGGITKQRAAMESDTGGNKYSSVIKEGWAKALTEAHGDEAVARAIVLGAPPMDDRMVGTWISYKFDESGWWAGQVKKVSACSLVEGSGTGCVVDSAVGNGSAGGGSAAEEDGEGQMSEAVINGCLVRDMRSELLRLELEASGVKRILLQRLLAAQSEGRKLKLKTKPPPKKRTALKTSSATRDINKVPQQAGWAWIEFGDGEANWFHLRASHFGDEMTNKEVRGAWRNALTTDQGIGEVWGDGGSSSNASAAVNSSSSGGMSSADVLMSEAEEQDGDVGDTGGGATTSSSSDEDGGAEEDGADCDYLP